MNKYALTLFAFVCGIIIGFTFTEEISARWQVWFFFSGSLAGLILSYAIFSMGCVECHINAEDRKAQEEERSGSGVWEEDGFTGEHIQKKSNTLDSKKS